MPILTCTDGSAYAPSLYLLTAWASKRMGARVEVLNVYTAAAPFFIPPVNFMGDPSMGSASLALPELTAISEAQEEEARKAAQALVKEAGAALYEAGVDDVQQTVMSGTLPDALAAVSIIPDLVMLGKRGESTAAQRDALGSQLETVVRQSYCPLLIASHDFKEPKRFLVSFDDSPSAHAALRFVAQNRLLKGLPCDLMMAGDDSPENRQALDSARTLLQDAGFEVQDFLMQGDPETVSTWEIEANHIDLLVMGAYSHSRFLQFFIGSTTTEIIRSCRVPVLVMGGKMPHLTA